jgi:hypothetical protein
MANQLMNQQELENCTNQCPYCFSTNLVHGNVLSYSGESPYCLIDCVGCKAKYRVVYKPASITVIKQSNKI